MESVIIAAAAATLATVLSTYRCQSLERRAGARSRIDRPSGRDEEEREKLKRDN